MDRPLLSDERLMTLAAGGDEQAFHALVRRNASFIYTVAVRMTGNESAGEEVFVDVVSTLWIRKATYTVGRPFRPWMVAITANACRERARRANRWKLFIPDESAAELPSRPSSFDRAAGEECSAEVAAAVARLPAMQREVVVLRIWGEMKYEHIAESLGVSEAGARSNMHHALAAMRRMLGDVRPAWRCPPGDREDRPHDRTCRSGPPEER